MDGEGGISHQVQWKGGEWEKAGGRGEGNHIYTCLPKWLIIQPHFIEDITK